MEFKDYYATLGVPKHSSSEEIQKAYRKLARKYHPDVNRNPKAEDRFKEITEAYEVLRDQEKRSTYDRYGAAWKNGGQTGWPPPGFENIRFDFGNSGGGGSGFSSFFDMLFSNRGGGSPSGGGGSPFGGGDPFADAGDPFGAGSPFGGRGGRGRGRGRGRGWQPRGQDHEAKIALTLEEAALGGSREITINDPALGRPKTYSVNLPPGVKAGQKIRLQGRGGQSAAGGPAGDLFLQVDLKPHPRFRLEDLDLYTEIPVTPWEAALGGEATVKTLNSSVRVRIPPGSSSGRKIRLRDRGFPAKDGNGDLFAEIRIMIPDPLTEPERELFEELARTSSFKAR
ncbi:MAG: DnaJ domain-containing protein [bacterium]|nr:DnaJ domain-containing protein [bacterium]